MLKVISWSIIGFVYNFLSCYLFSELTNDCKFKINRKIIIFSFIFSLINCYSVYYCIEFRTVILNLSLIMLFIICYGKSIVTCGLVDIYIFLILSICEILFVMIFSWLFGVNVALYKESIKWMFISNTVILLMTFLIIRNLKFRKFKIVIDKTSDKYKEMNMVFLIILSLLIISILVYPISTFQLPKNLALTYATIFFTGIIFIVAFFNAKNKQTKVKQEYDSLQKYMKLYEDLINEKSKQQHENRNQLIIIKSMLTSKNSKASKYIDQILNIEDDTKNYNYLNKLNHIPEGLKGLFFYKIEEMKKLGIDVYLDVPNKFDKNSVKICEKNLSNLSRIIGVYLDNAKEAAMIADKKYVVIQIMLEKYIEFTISNTYKEVTNIDKIDKIGFTTKGKGHGYGLPLVKDILSKNANYKQTREFSGQFYVQKLIIKND